MLETATIQSRQTSILHLTSAGQNFSSINNRISSSNLLPPEVSKKNTTGTREISSNQKVGSNRISTVQLSPEARSYFKSLESWVGQVTNIDEINSNFTALVISDTHSETREIAEFSFEEISEDDLLLVKPGAIFYWSVGYKINKSNGRSIASILRFKRIQHWIQKEVVSAKARANEYSDWFVRGSNGTIDAASGE